MSYSVKRTVSYQLSKSFQTQIVTEGEISIRLDGSHDKAELANIIKHRLPDGYKRDVASFSVSSRKDIFAPKQSGSFVKFKYVDTWMGI